MPRLTFIPTALGAVLMTSGLATAGQYVVELDAPFAAPSTQMLQQAGVVVDEILSAGIDSYVVVTAQDEDAVRDLMQTASITQEKISEVLFINSPTVAGGESAGTVPRDGHQVYVIERPIPGVGFFGLDKKRTISENSNAAIAKLGDTIEWDYSYLTGEGTYCIYRADSSDTLREHGALAGAPIGKITPVTQMVN